MKAYPFVHAVIDSEIEAAAADVLVAIGTNESSDGSVDVRNVRKAFSSIRGVYSRDPDDERIVFG